MSLNAHLAVMRNPFSTAVPSPKVMDGRAALSSSERANTSFPLTSSGGKMTILLIPGYTCPAAVYFDGGDGTTADPKYGCGFFAEEHRLTKTTTGVAKANTSADKFRLVSAGMRVSAINNSENNNGWFEAIRINPSWSTGDFGLAAIPNQSTKVVIPGIERLELGLCNFDNTTWANSPSYITGKLRDLHKHMFYLQTQDDREFTKIAESVEVDVTAVSGQSLDAINATKGGDDLVTQSFDTVFDMIALRIHTTPSSSTALQASVHIHTVHNFENIYDPANGLARFHTPTMSFPGAVMQVDRAIKSDFKPSVIRQASGGRYNPRYRR